ncbi:ATP-dependent DNA helicase pif1-like [Condylostylus longicornis]|uniref:ATP-dependent DNA helicase pif1-like n=1 Tax=Condylostylus longicornis TaxID=2530218 RepID=UPI00244DDA93|nr:ATP-dependent DNA helicase pif1-like [Condylostylus longicornis]
MLINRIPCYGYEDLKTINGVTYETFQEVAKIHGFLNNINEYKEALEEARNFKMAPELLELFTIIILNGGPARVLWDEFKTYLSEDFSLGFTPDLANNKALSEISRMLRCHGSSLQKMGLPEIIDDSSELGRERLRWSRKNCKNFVKQWEPKLNGDQLQIYFEIIDVVKNQPENGRSIFIDGPAGTGKTILLTVITAKLRSMGKIVLPTATTGIAAINHEGGITAHSMFKLPLNIQDDAITWGVTVSSERAELINEADLIILDEAPMAHKNLVQCINLGLQDITLKKIPFGGKIILLAGDFRQIPPIVPGASPKEIISSSLRSSALWQNFSILTLLHSMRAVHDAEFSVFIRRLGEGRIPSVKQNDGVDLIKLPNIPFETSVEKLISFVFPRNIIENSNECSKRAILSGTNVCIGEINKKVLEVLPGNLYHLYSVDSSLLPQSTDPAHHLGPEILNSVTQPGVPDHDLVLKKGALIILTRTLNFSEGLVNGTKLIVTKVTKILLEAQKPYSNIKHLIPRINFKFSIGCQGMEMIRRQFPIKLPYAMTINKSQGQTLSRVGIDLRNDVFSHGQLYVALGRARTRAELMVLIPPERIINGTAHTVNIVYQTLVL